MDPAIWRGIADLGALGFALIAVWALGSGRVTPRDVPDALRKERDEWKALALSAVERVDALGDAVEDLVERLPAGRK